MSTLDQAFAKAYGQPAESRKRAEARSLLSARPEPIAETPHEDPGIPPAAATPEDRAESAASTPERHPATRRPLRSGKRTRVDAGESSRPEVSRRPVSGSATAVQSSPVGSQAVARVPASTESARRPARSQFRPLLEVDNFKWPDGVSRLIDAADEPLEQLLTNLVTRSIRGQKVIAWQGCRRSDGCTTLMLAAARRLAERGVKVIVVDAEFRQPRLARHLGLMPTVGWEEVLAGRLPLADVVVESLGDQVALLPLCAPGASEPGGAIPDDPAASLETLRSHYDLVLVDLGRARKSEDGADLVFSGRPWIDAVILVHHVGKTPQTELSHAKTRLRRAGISDVAVVENFV